MGKLQIFLGTYTFFSVYILLKNIFSINLIIGVICLLICLTFMIMSISIFIRLKKRYSCIKIKNFNYVLFTIFPIPIINIFVFRDYSNNSVFLEYRTQFLEEYNRMYKEHIALIEMATIRELLDYNELDKILYFFNEFDVYSENKNGLLYPYDLKFEFIKLYDSHNKLLNKLNIDNTRIKELTESYYLMKTLEKSQIF